MGKIVEAEKIRRKVGKVRTTIMTISNTYNKISDEKLLKGKINAKRNKWMTPMLFSKMYETRCIPRVVVILYLVY
jgi:hypothetical protein